ncbi:glycosyltransferase family 39 protein [Gammaproteobacteria bacterium]|nr:glycosyltransferase family 39 protein [Gammaproteobacteria bacterium]
MLSTSNNNSNNGWILDLLLISTCLTFIYFLWIGSYPLFTPDEGRYSEIAREMALSGDYITPRLNGIAFLDKPILYYWLQASAINMFGLKEWSLRFWPATIGILGTLIVYTAGRIVYNRKTGIISSVILATTPLYFSGSHYANLDLEVSVFISSTLLFFLISTKTLTIKKTNLSLYLAYTFSALAFLTKGLIGIAFPIMIIGSYILFTNQWKLIPKLKIIPGLIIFLCITTPWYLLAQIKNPQFFNYFFILQQFSRYLTKAQFNNQAAVWFYIPIIVIGFFPWISFFIQSICKQFKSLWLNNKEHRPELFIILWFFIVLCFFSIPKSKTIGYILPVFPSMSLIVGKYISDNITNFKRFGPTSGIYLYIISCLLISTLAFTESKINFFHLDTSIKYYLYTGTIIFFASGLISYLLFKLNKNILLFSTIAITSSIFLMVFIKSAHLINMKSIKPLSLIINANIKAKDEIVTYYHYYQDLPIYTQKRINIVANWKSDRIKNRDNWKRELWYHMKYTNSSQWLIEEPELINKWGKNKRLFLLIHKKVYPVFLKNLQNSYKNNFKIFNLGSMNYNNKNTILLISNMEQ